MLFTEPDKDWTVIIISMNYDESHFKSTREVERKCDANTVSICKVFLLFDLIDQCIDFSFNRYCKGLHFFWLDRCVLFRSQKI